jgi:hypothetical protein
MADQREETRKEGRKEGRCVALSLSLSLSVLNEQRFVPFGKLLHNVIIRAGGVEGGDNGYTN